LATGEQVAGKDHLFKFSKNAQSLTYGQINALGGDFYGTYMFPGPISDGKTDADQMSRFKAAWDTLDTAGNTETGDIIKILVEEVTKVNAAYAAGKDPSEVYGRELPDVTNQLARATDLRYLYLASINWDHFGPDARTAYNAGHGLALDEAVRTDGNLELAYSLNAFADHFLEDSFSAGHLRNPRRALHSSWNKYQDMCSKVLDQWSKANISSCTMKTMQLVSRSHPARAQSGGVTGTSELWTRPTTQISNDAKTLSRPPPPKYTTPGHQRSNRRKINIKRGHLPQR
jgi:hypothetical protein